MNAARLFTDRAKLALGLFFVLAVSACGEDVIFVDREPFNPPPDAVSGFLGYFTASQKQTTCGNCHADYQADWVTTAHADAWATLQANSANQASCNGCHTVSDRGNAATDPAGYPKVADEAYHDVQCESCHGPGLEHVEGVGQGQLVRPLARVGLTGDGNCGDCHSGTHQPFVEEWSASPHAQIVASAATRTPCNSCHDGRGVLAAWGVDHNYVERGETEPQPTTCAVCHNPHGSSNSKQLRFSISSPDPELNLCMKCHIRRDEPAGGSSHGTSPHAPQGSVLLGIAGYRPPNFEYDTARVFGTHATERNPKLCAGCHVGRFTVTDPASGNFVFQATGHLFRPIPCVDAQGIPSGDNSCAYTETARSWKTCTTTGCHGNAAAAANIFNGAMARLEDLADVLWIDVDENEAVNATDQGFLATVMASQPGEFAVDATISPAEGAEFNAKLCGPGLYANGDRSKGAHNIFLCEALLRASIDQLQTTYGLGPPSVAAQRILAQPLGGTNAGAVQVSRTSVWR
jgi:predicted CXXCH cytochrome family protein